MRAKKKRTEEVSLKTEAIKVSRAIMIFFIVYVLLWKLYQVSVKKTLDYNEIEKVSISAIGSGHHLLNEDGVKMVVDCFNDLTHIKRNTDCGSVGTPDYTLDIELKNGERICMIPAGDTWAVQWYNMAEMSWLDAWGNVGADTSLYYWGDSSELREIWDDVLWKVYKVE